MLNDFSSFLHVLDTLNGKLWDLLVIVLIVIGLTFSIRSRFVQFRYLGEMFVLFAKAFSRKGEGISSFQALVLSIAGCVGTGNIAGVAIAIAIGGPGSIFWMWVAALLGMATSYFECTLAQVYKIKGIEEGTYRGGPGFYMLYGLKSKKLSYIYSLLLLLTYGFSFTALQAYTVSYSFQDSFAISPLSMSIGLTLTIMIVIFGGIYRIMRAVEYLVPIKACGYIAICLVVIGLNITKVPELFASIFQSAFGFGSLMGGTIGSIISIGIRRGLFANEAGLGGAPNVAAISRVDHPAEQGIIQSLSVFINTIILCTCTALVILVAGVGHPNAKDGAILAQIAFSKELGEWGRYFISIALFLFAFTTIIYNSYLGENALNFMRKGGASRVSIIAYRLVLCAIVFVACIVNLKTVLTVADFMMGLLSFCNLLAIALLMGEGLKVMRDYDRQHYAGVKPVFSAQNVNLPNLPEASPWKTIKPQL